MDLFRASNPHRPLLAGDSRYVDFSAERGTSVLLQSLEDGIRGADDASTQLICGQRGCGKTTELFRLRSRLEPDYFVVYLDAEDALDLYDTDASDVLLRVAASVWDEVHSMTDISLEAEGIRSIFAEVRSLFSLSGQADLTVPVIFTTIKATLKYDPKNRGLLRDHLTNRPTNLRAAVNEILHQAKETLAARKHRDIVVIVDNLDRVSSAAVPNSEKSVAERLFFDSWTLLGDIDCHVIYTVPPSISYSPRAGQLRTNRIPMVPVCKRNGDPETSGLTRLREVIERRIEYVKLDRQAVFADESSIRNLCRMSGGFERQLLRLLQGALSAQKGFPLQQSSVDVAIRSERDFLAQGLVAQQERWARLREIAAARPGNFLAADRDMLDNHYILEYKDEAGYWYDVNPVLRLAPAFEQ